jgi:hypothetical protein
MQPQEEAARVASRPTNDPSFEFFRQTTLEAVESARKWTEQGRHGSDGSGTEADGSDRAGDQGGGETEEPAKGTEASEGTESSEGADAGREAGGESAARELEWMNSRYNQALAGIDDYVHRYDNSLPGLIDTSEYLRDAIGDLLSLAEQLRATAGDLATAVRMAVQASAIQTEATVMPPNAQDEWMTLVLDPIRQAHPHMWTLISCLLSPQQWTLTGQLQPDIAPFGLEQASSSITFVQGKRPAPG